jgi:hypothetical protein
MYMLHALTVLAVVGAMLLTTAPASADCGGSHGGDGYNDGRHHEKAHAGDDHQMADQRRHAREDYRRADGKAHKDGKHYGERQSKHDKGWRKHHRAGEMRWRRHGHMMYRQRPWAVLETSGEYDPAIFVGVWPARPTHGVWWQAGPAGAEMREVRIYRRDALEGAEERYESHGGSYPLK